MNKQTKKNKKSPLLVFTKWVAIALITVAVAAPLLGLLQDAFNVHCTGFFGARGTCVENWLIFDGVILLSPITLVLVGFVTVLGFIDRYNRNSKD